jgi:hypothetical protein
VVVAVAGGPEDSSPSSCLLAEAAGVLGRNNCPLSHLVGVKYNLRSWYAPRVHGAKIEKGPGVWQGQMFEWDSRCCDDMGVVSVALCCKGMVNTRSLLMILSQLMSRIIRLWLVVNCLFAHCTVLC